MEYREEDLMRLAKRVNNAKRAYLIVNPLQGKHVPVSPTAALTMMGALGTLLARVHPRADLVIGFAETATAVGAAVAAALPGPAAYLHTTREAFALSGGSVDFLEEHSHAAHSSATVPGRCRPRTCSTFPACRRAPRSGIIGTGKQALQTF